jgi:NADPH2:quinone reductase
MYQGKTWKAPAFGEPADVLRVEDATWDEPAEGLVLVRVLACGLGMPDVLMTRGGYPLLPKPPVSPGQEVAGEVVATAPGSRFAVGDRVMGLTAYLEGWGGLGDYAYVGEGKARPVPDTLTDEQAAGFMLSFRTAYAGLADRVQVKSAENLLVLGASGGSGAAAIRLGKALGAIVIAVAGSAEKLRFCIEMGADHVVNYREADVAEQVKDYTDGRGADVVFDPVGGHLGTRALAAVARLGRVAIIGYASGNFLTLDPLDMVLRNYTAVGVFASGTAEEDAVAYDELCRLAGVARITTPLTRVVGFEDVPRALATLHEYPGKSVVRIATN